MMGIGQLGTSPCMGMLYILLLNTERPLQEKR